MKRMLSGFGGVLLFASAAVALGRVLTATYPQPPRRLDSAERAQLGRTAAGMEPYWRNKSRRSFPGDQWSQDDDFGASERAWALTEASRLRVPISDVLRAVDEDLHAHPPEPPRRATSAQCKPRPFYD
jgi:hypothetical protein